MIKRNANNKAFSAFNLMIGLLIIGAITGGAYLVVRGGGGTTNKPGTGLGAEFSFDIGAYRKTDANLIAYQEIKGMATGLSAPKGIAVDKADRIYVAGDKAVNIFAADGNGVVRLTLADSPRCIAVGPNGLIYVGMKDRVEVYDPAKVKRVAGWPPLGAKAQLTSIAVNETDAYVADAGNRVVYRCNLNGMVLREIGRKDEARGIAGLNVPSPHLDVAMGHDTLLRVSDPGRWLIEAYTSDGDLELSWGKSSMGIAGFCGCCNPTDFAILPDGSFVTAEKGLPRVKVYDAKGVFQCVVAGAESFKDDVVGLDVAADSQGRILVLDPKQKAVRIFVRKQN